MKTFLTDYHKPLSDENSVLENDHEQLHLCKSNKKWARRQSEADTL